MDALERRRFVRVPIGLESSCQVGDGGGLSHAGVGEDLSLGGMRVRQQEPLALGRKVQVVFSLPEEGRVSLGGIVVWCRPSDKFQGSYEAGLRWEESTPASQARLNAFLTQRTHPVPSIAPPVIPIESVIRWPQVVGLALATAVLLMGTWYLLFERSRLSSEAATSRTANEFHETQMKQLR